MSTVYALIKLAADLHHLLLATMYLFVTFLSLQTRKFKELLERNLGWEFQQSSAVDGIYFEENDEVSIRVYLSCFAVVCVWYVCSWTLLVHFAVRSCSWDVGWWSSSCLKMWIMSSLGHNRFFWGTKPWLSRHFAWPLANLHSQAYPSLTMYSKSKL